MARVAGVSALSRLPWWSKIGAKLILSRLGIPYGMYQRMGLFRHGEMDSVRYLLDVCNAHVTRAGLGGTLRGRTILEIGPGDSIGTALFAHAHGARAILIDTGRHAIDDIAFYRSVATVLREQGLPAPPLGDADGLDQVLAACGASYLTGGLASWGGIDDGSVDLVFSQAVLEHVRKHEFEAVIRESRRVLKPHGAASHRVDLQDHLGGGLNNLRFSSRVWESDLFAMSGFYTNRIQYHRMLQLFSEAGFSVSVTDVRRWQELPMERKRLAAEFRDLPDEELRISGFDVVLRPLAQ